MNLGVQNVLLPPSQRRSLEELTAELDFNTGDGKSKKSGFWVMLTLSAVIASAGVLSDSVATVIGAMIIAPLSTPIMGTALQLVKRESLTAPLFVLGGSVLTITIGALFSLLLPGGIDLANNPQITGRTSPGVLDLVAALATGLAGALALSRRDVATVAPGVAIAISLVPPLAVVGVCLGEGEYVRAAGALVLFLSNIVALVLGGTTLFAALSYSDAEYQAAHVGPDKRSQRALYILLAIIVVPLALNTFAVSKIHQYSSRIEKAGTDWVRSIPGAEVTSVSTSGTDFVMTVRSPENLPPAKLLVDALQGEVPGFVHLVVETTAGRSEDLGRIGPESSDS